MTEEHDRIEELLAGYVLRTLSGEDADAADRLLTEHVSACPMCRETLSGFQGVAGELALAPAPSDPPDILLPRIRRALSEVPTPRRRRVSLVAAAAGVAAIVGMAGLSMFLGVRVSRVQEQSRLVQEALAVASRPEANQVALDNVGEEQDAPMTEISAPGLKRIYLVGRGIPPAGAGHVYAVWLGSADRFTWVGEFVPDPGQSVTVLELTVDRARYDRILITEEIAGTRPSAPSDDWQWSASL